VDCPTEVEETGSATFTGLTESNNAVNIQNATSTFTITVN